jgi:hypothetical protein
MLSKCGRKCACGRVAHFGAREKRPKERRLLGFLNGCRLEIVELGEHELLELWIAAGDVYIERRPGFIQKYL